MCGFILQKKISKAKILNKKLFKASSKLIFNRGPDNQTYYCNDTYNIFHARLKIIDLSSNANQPFEYMGYNIIYNGEIYNFNELKNNLKVSFSFKTSSDTEVLLYAYIKWGVKMFSKIEGMYSFIIYNFKKDVIFFSRDLFGQKPLYYFKNNNEVIFSSEIKPIIKLLSPKKIEFEQKEINKYLNYNFYGDTNLTFFRNIFQVPPGTYGYIKNKKIILKKIKLKKDKFKINEKKLIEILKYEIKNHLISDVDIGIMISDGIDSRSILDLSEKFFKKKLKLFNLEFEDFDKTNFTETYKKKFRDRLIITKFLKKDFLKTFNNAAKVCEAPPLSLFTLGMMKLFENINKNKIKVVLNGQGIDEIFGGYDALYNSLNNTYIHHPSGQILSDQKKLFIKKISKKLEVANNQKSKRFQLAFKTKIPKNLNQYDKISMHNSVENRSPYLTPKLASLIYKLKLNQVYNNNHTKYIFRKILYKITKDKSYFQKKIYQQAPQSEFMLDRNIFYKITNIINKKNYCDIFFIKKNILKYLSEFKKKKNNGFLIWQYLSLNFFINYYKNINF